MELYRLTIHELRDLIQKGEVSPVEVVQNFLVRIGQVEDRIQAYNTLTSRTALAFAKKFEDMQVRKEEVPPLAGIPLAIKDNMATRGSTLNSRASLAASSAISASSSPVIRSFAPRSTRWPRGASR